MMEETVTGLRRRAVGSHQRAGDSGIVVAVWAVGLKMAKGPPAGERLDVDRPWTVNPGSRGR